MILGYTSTKFVKVSGLFMVEFVILVIMFDVQVSLFWNLIIRKK